MHQLLAIRGGMIVAVALLLALALPAGGRVAAHPGPPDHEHLTFRTISVEQGLPHFSVYGVAQDRFGFMWFATVDGLVRYDGNRIETYRPDPLNPNSPAAGQIWCLYADREGVIWAGAIAGGLSRYDPRTERFTNYRHDRYDPNSLSSDAVRAIYQDSTGALWVGTLNSGLNRLDPASGRFTRYRHDPADPDSLSHDRVEDIVEDGRGGLWVATYGGLDRLDPASGRFSHYRHDPADPTSLGGNQVHALLRDRSGTLWVGVYGAGLYRLDEAAGRFARYRHDPAAPNTLSSNNVNVITEDHAGTIWVGTFDDGLNRLDRASGAFTRFPRTLPPGQGMPSEVIVSLFPGADGLLWVGTEDRGVTIVDRRARGFTIHRADIDADGRPNTLRPGIIRAVTEDRDGTLWIGIASVGLDRFDRARGLVTHYNVDPADPGSPLSDRAQAMLVARDGTLWIGYNGGLDRFDRAADRFVHYHPDPDDPAGLSHADIFDLHESRDGAIWVATRGGGLNRLDPATGRFTHYRHDPADPSSISSDSVIAVVEDQRGGLWAGTEDAGLSRFDPATGHFTHYRSDPADPASLGSNTVAALFVDSGGTLWAATWNSGLDRFEPSSDGFVRYQVKDGLLTGKINGIEEDRHGKLWLSSNQGLSKLDPQSGATEHFTGASAGLPDGGYPLNGSSTSSSGEIILGGVDHLVTFYPEQIEIRTEAAPVVFSSFLLSNRRVSVGDGSPLTSAINASSALTLSHRDRVIGFEFAALDYRAPGAVRYRYRLDGFDKDWIETGSERRSATYTNLSPGRYVFRVRATNGDGVWGQEERSIAITITPPWWQTWWFIMLAGLTAVASVGGGFRYRLLRLEARQQQLEREVAARTSELSAANLSLASEVAERSRAETEARAARDELDRQLAIENELVTTLDLDAILGRILDQIGEVVSYESALIAALEGNELIVRAVRSTYLPSSSAGIRVDPRRVPQLVEAIKTSEPQIFADLSQDRALLAYLDDTFGQSVRGRTWLVAPLAVQGAIRGLIVLAHTVPGHYGPADARQLETFTSPIAIALQNADLHQAAQNAAVLEERSRLARELHDAVTQTLFSASLIAEALPSYLPGEPERVVQGAQNLRRLTAGALAEMRTLLLELRPKALTEKPLGGQLQLLCTSVQSRTAVPVRLVVVRDCTLEPAVQLAFYRVTQEALNNIVKHAEARQVQVSIDCAPDEVILSVCDDGRGFDYAQVRPDSLGLGIMRERAADVGASLTIAGEPGRGTTVTLRWQAPRRP
jgi:signal transduction histidine kinase/ligand-binding sensor domain-containing protein